jgi:hypothetical protein
MNWTDIKDLKAKYKTLCDKAHSAKTRGTQDKYRELAREVKRTLSDELSEWTFDDLDFTQFNIMAPIGGPYCLVSAKDFKVERNLGASLVVSFESSGTRYAGYLHWVDDKCGFDNMKQIC